MSDTQNTETTTVDLTTISPELRKVIEFDEVPEALHNMIVSIHEVTEEAVREAWDSLPGSAQNILDNFEQFHGLISVSQGFAGVNTMEEFASMDLPKDMSDEEKEDYRANLIDKVLHNCIKDMVKQIKKARRDPL
ncbi:DUF3069 domain-containing protein [Vibrio sp. ZSDZ65]|uniref:DUF3069 domain-containing protein n=1 Tax=Vibrio qingdaonensis TaxID=2829491 RepID=A0A9X3CMG4_9VIBR|nr:DUF3069 domain-containing protein [Vibrio qingdaonensis]MCW8346000.1 DUF3069 domain-containing protein [Vibrio qingdaonensis]